MFETLAKTQHQKNSAAKNTTLQKQLCVFYDAIYMYTFFKHSISHLILVCLKCLSSTLTSKLFSLTSYLNFNSD